MREVLIIFCLSICVMGILVVGGIAVRIDIAKQCDITGSFQNAGQAYSCQPVRKYGSMGDE